MTPYYADDWLTVYGGDARDVLPTLDADSVDCIVTSPPYWGLRDYGTASWAGGDPDHEHIGQELRTADTGGPKQQTKRGSIGVRSGDCECGATRSDGQLGLERTPEEYVANMVDVFRELRRVLKPSGTCWLNLGDSYNGVGRGEKANGLQVAARATTQTTVRGLKPKDLVGIPWRVAFALQANGWYLRSDIIWSKPNPMPESVTDRPTKAHEYLFLLTRSSRYYFDADAVREPNLTALPVVSKDRSRDRHADDGELSERSADGWGSLGYNPAGRNLRSVWTIATRPYPGAHFAVFPPELPERCIKAGSSERGVCPECGAPWERVVERTPWRMPDGSCGCGVTHGTWAISERDGQAPQAGGRNGRFYCSQTSSTGWQPSCRHFAEAAALETGAYRKLPVPAVILDPFAGSGTTGMVANRLSRRAILIDLNPEYLKQQMKRNAQTPLGLGAA